MDAFSNITTPTFAPLVANSKGLELFQLTGVPADVGAPTVELSHLWLGAAAFLKQMNLKHVRPVAIRAELDVVTGSARSLRKWFSG